MGETQMRKSYQVQQEPTRKQARGRKSKAIHHRQQMKTKTKSSKVNRKESNGKKNGNTYNMRNKNKSVQRKRIDETRKSRKHKTSNLIGKNRKNSKSKNKGKTKTIKKLSRKGRKKSNMKLIKKGSGSRNGAKVKKTHSIKETRVTSCMEESCIDNAVSYIKLSKDKVANYLSQATRVEKFKKTAGSKAGKKGLFSPIINRIREAGGGNISNLKCNGNSTGNGAQAMKNLTDALGKCESNINKSCVTNLPAVNVNKSNACGSSMTTFEGMVKTCMAVAGTAACSCWNNQSFTAVVASIKSCDFSAENKKMTSAKKGCIAAFGACRKLEDSVSETLSACSPGNSAAKGKDALQNGKANKLAASSLLNKLNQTINGKSRSENNLTCAAFLIQMKKINRRIFNAPLSKKISSFINQIVNQTIGGCSTNETTNLKSEETKLSKNMEIIDEAMEDVQNDLKIQTGTTTSVASINIKISSYMLSI